MNIVIAAVRDGLNALMTIALIAILVPALLHHPKPGSEIPAKATESESRPGDQPQVESSPTEPRGDTDNQSLLATQGISSTTGHRLVCEPHNGCHEVCDVPHPIYSAEADERSYSGSRKQPRYTRCPTCTPSKAQLLWAKKLPRYSQLREQYTDQQIIQYFGTDKLLHLAGDYLPPEMDPTMLTQTIGSGSVSGHLR